MAYPGLAREEHQYLSKDFCTGYTDVYGKWNNGFYCPQYGSKTAVFCCGNGVFKYCCTDQTPFYTQSSDSLVVVDGHDLGGISAALFERVPIVFGIVCGIAAVLILLVVAACYFCSCCFAYKKRRSDLSHVPLGYHPTSNSTTSNLFNLYSPAGTNVHTSNLATMPVDLDLTIHTSSTQPAYPSQRQCPQFPSPGNRTLTPSLTAGFSQGSISASPMSYECNFSNCGRDANTLSVINNSTAENRLYSTTNAVSSGAEYYNLLNSSTSSVSSAQQTTTTQFPQHITASVIGCYLASIQNQTHILTHPDVQVSHLQPPPPYEPVRPPSPPPTYFQTVSSCSSGSNTTLPNRGYSSNINSERTIQSAFISNTNPTPGSCIIDNDVTGFILRHENTLRRTFPIMGNTSISNIGNYRDRGNSMQTQRELMELLVRLPQNQHPPFSSSDSSSSFSRSESRAGSESTTRSTESSATLGISTSPHNMASGTNIPSFGNKTPSFSKCKLTISELDEDLTHNTVSSKNSNVGLETSSPSKIPRNDSGVPSSTCSTAGSEASTVIGATEANARDELANRKKQPLLDGDD